MNLPGLVTTTIRVPPCAVRGDSPLNLPGIVRTSGTHPARGTLQLCRQNQDRLPGTEQHGCTRQPWHTGHGPFTPYRTHSSPDSRPRGDTAGARPGFQERSSVPRASGPAGPQPVLVWNIERRYDRAGRRVDCRDMPVPGSAAHGGAGSRSGTITGRIRTACREPNNTAARGSRGTPPCRGRRRMAGRVPGPGRLQAESGPPAENRTSTPRVFPTLRIQHIPSRSFAAAMILPATLLVSVSVQCATGKRAGRPAARAAGRGRENADNSVRRLGRSTG